MQVACIAFQDHIYAKDFERDMTNMLKMGPHEKRQSPWTRVHGHYALMGGFAFDPRKVDIKFFPGNRPQLTLTPGALKRIARYHEDLIPDIFEAEIKDKSKADGLAKTIVCIQALWYVPFSVTSYVLSVPRRMSQGYDLNAFSDTLN
jgi:hypothetical protein